MSAQSPRARARRPAAAIGAALFWAVAGSCVGGKDTPDDADPVTDTDTDTDTTEPTPDTAGIDTGGGTHTPRPVYDCYADVSIDDDGDGVEDGSGYDGWDADNPTWQLYLERDNNGNGIPEQFSSWVRDDAGRILRFEQWGVVAGFYEASYDDDGNRLTFDQDTDGDGLIDVMYTYVYENNALVYYDRDDGADGVVDYTLQYVRDAEGRRLSAEEDEDGDGIIDNLYTYTLDAQGREVEAAVDEGNDGVVDRVTTNVFTDPVLRVGTATIEDAEGELLQRMAFAFDASNRETYYAYDIPPLDETGYDYERWTERDANGAVLHYRLLTALYGDPLELLQEVTRDGLGRQTRVHTVVRNLTTGNIDAETTYSYLFGGTCPSA